LGKGNLLRSEILKLSRTRLKSLVIIKLFSGLTLEKFIIIMDAYKALFNFSSGNFLFILFLPPWLHSAS
jgi:hypothetical protein